VDNQQALRRPAHSPAFSEALRAWERGWSLIPCRADKRPDTDLLRAATGSTGWHQFTKRRCSFGELAAWADAEAFGVITGPVSGVVVLDVDPGGIDSIRGLHLPPTLIAKTPRGHHYFFNNPAEGIATKAGILHGVDVRGAGGYAVLAGPEGRYWLDAQDDTADAPAWLVEAAGKGKAKRTAPKRKAPVIALQTATEAIKLNGSIAGMLSHLYSRPEVALKLAPVLGIEVGSIGAAFCDILPGLEPDRSPSASLYQNQNGVILYRSFRLSDQFYQLGEVRASLAHGKPVKLVKRNQAGGIAGTTPEGVCWAIRLLIEGGVVEPAQVPHRPLESDAPKSASRVYAGFLELLSCKWLYTKDAPTPFSWRFAAAWCGMGERQAGEGMSWLLSHGYIKQEGKHKRTALFMPALQSRGNGEKGSK